ncbi:MAG: DUF211 domain-containing protein [Candidatus Bathyarchaeota archaeon]
MSTVNITRVLLDSLKSRELSIVELSRVLGSVNGVNEVDIVVVEVDSNTETIKVTLVGPQIDYNEVKKVMEKYGVSIKGIDEIKVVTFLNLLSKDSFFQIFQKRFL